MRQVWQSFMVGHCAAQAYQKNSCDFCCFLSAYMIIGQTMSITIIKYSCSCVNIHLIHVRLSEVMNRFGIYKAEWNVGNWHALPDAWESCTNNTVLFLFLKKRRRDLKCTGKSHLCNHCQFVTPDQFVNVGCAGLRPRVPSGLLAPGHLGKAAEQRRFRIVWMCNGYNLVIRVCMFKR